MSTLEKKELRVPCKAGIGEMLSKDREALSSVLADASIARQISDMIRAYRISQIVGTIALLEIPDRLASGARTAGELASLIGCHAGATHRLMRAASDLGLVASGPDARFTLTALGQSLRSDLPGSVRELGHRIDLSWTLAAVGTLERCSTHWTAPDGRGAWRRAI
jgi:hypothetical protein